MTHCIENPPASEVIAWAVEAFEAAVMLDPAVDLSAFIPLPGAPFRREVIAELVRVDMELAWRHSNPTRLAEYLSRFPILSSNLKTLSSVAFEEYRLRRICGEPVEPGEYERLYAIDVTLWPPILSQYNIPPM